MVSQPRRADVPAAQAYHRGVILAVDIGNSAAKAAIVNGTTVHEVGRLDTSEAEAADLLDGLRILAGAHDEAPTGIITVSVVDRWTERLERAAEELELPLTVVAPSHIPISTMLPRPDRAGPDRLLAAWAASMLYGSPSIVVDLGTATTVDAVDADGFFVGGAILPGLELAAATLGEGTARLPVVEVELPAETIGDDTTSAIQSGVVIGHIGAVRELVTRMRAQISRIGTTTHVIVTGGFAEASWAEEAWIKAAGADLPPIAGRLDGELVLKGLGLLADHMAARPVAGAQR